MGTPMLYSETKNGYVGIELHEAVTEFLAQQYLDENFISQDMIWKEGESSLYEAMVTYVREVTLFMPDFVERLLKQDELLEDDFNQIAFQNVKNLEDNPWFRWLSLLDQTYYLEEDGLENNVNGHLCVIYAMTEFAHSICTEGQNEELDELLNYYLARVYNSPWWELDSVDEILERIESEFYQDIEEIE